MALKKAVLAILPEELVAQKLADGVLHLDQLLDQMPGEIVREDVYAGVRLDEVGFEPVARVALIYGTGNVVSGRGSRSRDGSPVMAAETISEALHDAVEDPDIDAIVLTRAARSTWRSVC